MRIQLKVLTNRELREYMAVKPTKKVSTQTINCQGLNGFLVEFWNLQAHPVINGIFDRFI